MNAKCMVSLNLEAALPEIVHNINGVVKSTDGRTMITLVDRCHYLFCFDKGY